MHGRKRAIRHHYKVGPKAANVTTATLTVKTIRDQTEILEELEVQVHRTRGGRETVCCAWRDEIVENFEAPN